MYAGHMAPCALIGWETLHNLQAVESGYGEAWGNMVWVYESFLMTQHFASCMLIN